MTDAAVAQPAADPGVGAVTPRAQLTGISKQFGATKALTDVSLELIPARSTRSSARTGRARARWSRSSRATTSPTPARSDSTASSPTSRVRPRRDALGIAVVHQEPRLFPDLTVAENVFIGHAPAGAMGTIDWRGTRRAAEALFRELDVTMDVGAPVRGLSMADQQLIEIASRSPSRRAILILDEPTASLSAHEVERLFTIVRRLRARGVSICS